MCGLRLAVTTAGLFGNLSVFMSESTTDNKRPKEKETEKVPAKKVDPESSKAAGELAKAESEDSKKKPAKLLEAAPKREEEPPKRRRKSQNAFRLVQRFLMCCVKKAGTEKPENLGTDPQPF